MTEPSKHDELRPLDAQLFELVATAVEDGLAAIRTIDRSSTYLPRQFYWFEVDAFDNGLPQIHEDSAKGPIDYSQLFGWNETAIIRADQIPSFNAVKDYVLSNPRLLAYYHSYLDRESVLREHHEKFFGYYFVSSVIESFASAYGTESFSHGRLLPIYIAHEAGVIPEEIVAEIVVPILLTQFDFEEMELAEGVLIRRMSKPFQQARGYHLKHREVVHRWVGGAASHAFVLQFYTIQNKSLDLRGFTDREEVFPLDRIDLLFAALRIATNAMTGYAQVLLYQREWEAISTLGLIPALQGAAVRGYPSIFDKHGWLCDRFVLTSADLSEMSVVLQSLLDIGENSVTIASRRLNDAALRNRVDDAVIDALIGLETLFSDDEMGELTHKLALRVSAIHKLAGESKEKPGDVFQRVKKIYHYRSKVVHGKRKEADKLIKNYFDGNPRGPLDAATDFLRMALRTLIRHPEYIEPKQIDLKLLLGDPGTSEETDEERT